MSFFIFVPALVVSDHESLVCGLLLIRDPRASDLSFLLFGFIGRWSSLVFKLVWIVSFLVEISFLKIRSFVN